MAVCRSTVFESLVPRLFAASFLLLGLSGCAYIGAAVAVLAAGGDSGGGTAATNQPPSVLPTGVARPTLTALSATVDYDLIDPDGGTSSILVEFSTDGGLTFLQANELTGPPSEGTTDLDASDTGVAHVYVWDIFGDVFGNDLLLFQSTSYDVSLQFTPTDQGGEVGTAAQTSLGNQAPSVFISSVTATATDFFATVDYNLIDPNADSSDIVVEFSTDGGLSFGAASQGPGSEGTVDLAASVAGVNHVYVWNFFGDVPGVLTSSTQAFLRFTPTDANGLQGTLLDSSPFLVGNSPPEVVGMTPTPVGPADIVASIAYSLIDDRSDLIDILPEYSADGGLTFLPATPGLGGDGTSGLSASPGAGTAHVFEWAFGGDIPGLQTTTLMVQLRLTPTESSPPQFSGTAGLTTFQVGNERPIVSLDPIVVDPLDLSLVLTYTAFDDFGDPLGLLVEYSKDSFVTAQFATLMSPPSPLCADGSTALSSSPAGDTHCFEWNFPVDIAGASTPVVVRLTLTDTAGATSLTVVSEEFRVGNDPPIVVVSQPDTQFGVSLDFVLLDDTSDDASIIVEYATDDPPTFVQTTSIVGSTSGLTSTPQGVTHNIGWNSLADLGTGQFNTVRLRVTPLDAFATGTADETAPFILTTNDKPIVFIEFPLTDDVVAGEVQVSYRLIDFDSDPVDIVIEVRAGGSPTFLSATEVAGPPSEGVTGLTSSQTGIVHTFVWDSLADLGPLDFNNGEMRIIPSDASGTGTPAFRSPFRIDNNNEPRVQVTGTPPSPSTQKISIPYLLLDDESDAVDVVVDYSTDQGATFVGTATEAASGSDGTTGLTSAPAGTPHLFVWDSVADLGSFLVPDVVVRITPSDDPDPALGLGTAGSTTPFEVDNSPGSAPPTIDTVAPSLGNVAGGETVIITGSGFITGTTSQIGGQALVNESVVSVSTIIGDVPPSIVGTGFVDVTVTNVNGTAIRANGYRYTLPPTAILTSPLPGSSQAGNVIVNYDLIDPESDTTSISVQFSTDSGSNFFIATEAVGGEGKFNLTSSPTPGTPHIFLWNSVADGVGLSGPVTTVRVRITPSDTDTGTPGETGDFEVDNSVGRFALVTNYYEATVSVVDTVNLTEFDTDGNGGTTFPPSAPPGISRIPVGTNPWGIAVSNRGDRAAVANYSDDTISIIDLNTYLVLFTPDVGNGPSDLAFDHDGARIFVLNDLADTIAVIDTATGTELDTDGNPLTTDPGLTTGITRIGSTDSPSPWISGATRAVMAAGDSLFLAGAGHIIDTTTYAHLGSSGLTTTSPLVSLADGKHVYVSQAGGGVGIFRTDIRAEIDLDDDDSTASPSAPAGMNRLRVGNNALHAGVQGTRAYVVDNSDWTVSIVDTTTHTEVDADNDPGTESPGAPLGISRIPLPMFGDPRGIAINSIGSAGVVANLAVDSVTILEFGTNTAVGDVTVGDGPIRVALTRRSTTEPIPPALFGAVPDFGRALDVITLNGSGFDSTPANNLVEIGGLPGVVQTATTSQLTVEVPLGVTQGDITVDVGGLSANPLRFTPITGPLVYVAVESTDRVAVLDTGAGNVVVGAIPAGNGPWTIAISPTGDRAYVSNRFSDDVTVIDLVTHTVIATVPVGDEPRGIDTTIDGSLVFVNNIGSNDTMSVIDAVTLTEIDTDNNINTTDPGLVTGLTRMKGFAYGNRVHALPTGDRMMVGNTDVIDIATYTKLPVYPIWTTEDFAFTDDSSTMFYSDWSGNLGRYPDWFRREIDLDDNYSTTSSGAATGITRLAVGTSPAWVQIHGDRIWTANTGDGGAIAVIDLPTLTEIDTDSNPGTTDPTAPPGITRLVTEVTSSGWFEVRENGSEGYLTNFSTGRLQITDLVAYGVLTEPVVGASPRGIAIGLPSTSEPFPPVVGGITGPVMREGAVFTITGSGFDPTPANNTVVVGGAAATVTSSTASSIDTTVPVGALTGDVTVTVGGLTSNPVHLHVSSGPFLYVSSMDPDGVVVIDLVMADLEPVALMPTGGNPVGIAIHPSGSTLYSANSTGDSVTVMDLATHSAVTTIPTGDNCQWVAVSGDGSKVLAYNIWADTVSFIDTVTNTVTNTISGISVETGLPIESGGARVYAGGVEIIDVASEQEIGWVDVPNYATGDRTMILPGDRFAWRTDSGADNISIVDLRQRKEIDLDKDASTTSTGAPTGITRIAAGDGCQNMSLGGGRVHVTNTATTNLSVFDLASQSEIDTDNDFLTTDAGAPAGITRIVPGGSGMNELVSDGAGDLTYVSMTSSAVVSLIRHDTLADTYAGIAQISVGTSPRGILIGKGSASEPARPIVAEISGGVVRIGDTLFITGSGFDPTPGNNIVLVNGIPATVLSASATLLEIIIPAGATSGDITVEVAGILSNPVYVTVATGPFAYVTCRLGDIVSVIDLATREVVTGIPVGNDPRSIAILPDGSRAYVTNFISDDISVIDLATHQVAATIPASDGPHQIVAHPDGTRIFAILQNTDEVLVVDTATELEVTRVTGITWDYDLTINPQGTELLSGGYQLIDVDPLSPTVYQLLGLYDQGPGTWDRSLFLDGGVELWRSDESADNIAVYKSFLRKQIDVDRDSATTSTSTPVTGISRLLAGNQPREIAALGDNVYVPNFIDNSLSIYDVPTRTQLDTDGNGLNGITPFPLPSGMGPWVLALDPINSLVVVGGFTNDVASIVDISTPTAPVLLADVTVGNEPYGIAIGKATAWEPSPPVIARLTQRLAEVSDGITITGVGFDPTPANNTVLFNGTPATVTSATTTSLDVTVPVGATTGNLSVEVAGLVSNRILFHVDPRPLLYVNSWNPDGVVVVDPILQEAIELIPTQRNPYELVITPDGSRLYTVNETDDSVTAIDLATHTVIQHISVGDSPRFIARNGDGTKVFTHNWNTNTITVVDTDPVSPNYHTVIDTIAGVSYFGGFEAEAGGARLYSGGYEIIDLVNHAEIGVLDPGPHGTADRMVILPGDTYGWRADQSTDNIGVIHLRARKEIDLDDDASTTSAGPPAGSGITRMPAGDGVQNMAVAGGRMYASNVNVETISVFDIAGQVELDTDGNAGNGLTRIPSGGFDPAEIAPDVANDRAYVAVLSSDFLTVVDFDPVGDTYAASAQITVGDNPITVLLGPATTSEPVGPIVSGIGGGIARIGDTLIITGSGFDPIPGNNTVLVNGILATVVSATATTLQISIPAGAATGDLTVEVAGLLSNAVFITISTGPFAYVACQAADAVTVIDLSTLEVVAGIPVGNDPRGIGVLSDGSKAYVSNFISDSISVIDLETHRVVATIPTGDGPEALAVHPDGTRVYAQLRNVGQVAVFDTTTDTEVDTDGNPVNGITRIPGITYTEQLAINQQGTEMLARSYQRVDVDPLSPTLYQVIPVYDEGPSAADRGVYLDGGVEYWRTDQSADNVALYKTFMRRQYDLDITYATTSTSTPQLGLTRLTAGNGPRGIAQGGGTVYAANGADDNLSIYDIASRSLLTTFPVGADFPYLVAVDEGTSLLLAAGSNNDVVSIVDITVPGTPVLLGDLTVGDLPRDMVIGKGSASEPLSPRIVRTNTRIGKVGDPITIIGVAFDPTPANNTVLLNGTAATVTSATSTSLDLTVPGGATTGFLTVEVGGLLSNKLTFHVDPGPFIYVNSFIPNGVVVLDPDLLESIDLLPTGGDPLGMVIVPDGSRLYTANETGDSVTAIDLDSHSVITTISTADRPSYIVTNGDGTKVFSQNRNVNTATVIDTDPLSPTYHQVIDTISGVSSYWGFVAESGGARGYTGGLEIIDLDSHTEIGVLDPGTGTGDRLTILPGDAFAWRSDQTADNIALVNLRLRGEVDIDNDASTTSTSAQAGVTRMAAGNGPQHMGVAGGRMYVSNTAGDNISLFDIAGQVEIDTDNDPLTTSADAPPLSGISRIGGVGLDPRGITADVANDRAFVAVDASDLVTLIEWDSVGDTYSATAQISVGDRPQIALLGPTGGSIPFGPAIVELSAGLARVGDTVFIQGTGFDPIPGNNIVLVDGVAATVVSATSTLLEITIPGGATSGLITVEVGLVLSNAVFITVASGPFAYVTCEAADAVAVIDLSLMEVVTGIPVLDAPMNIAVLPDGSKAYVTSNNSTNSRISIIDLDNHTVSSLNIPAPGATRPEGVAVHPNGTEVYVALRNMTQFAVIDTATDTEIDTDFNAGSTDPSAPPGVTRMTSGGYYWEVDVNPEGTLLLAGSYFRIDVEPGSPTLYTQVGILETGGSTADRIEFIDGGAEIWRTDSSADNIALYKTFLRREIDMDLDYITTSTAAPTGVTRMTAGNDPRGIAQLGGKVWVGNSQADTLSVYDVVTRTETTQIPLTVQYPWNVDVEPSTNTVVVVGRDTDSVTLVDAVTDTVLIDLGVGNSPREVAVGKPTTVEPIPPRITSIDTNIGITGDTVQITGIGFDPTPANNTVLFDGTAATVNTASATLLDVTVPAAVTTGLITVEVSGLVSNGAQFWATGGPFAYLTDRNGGRNGLYVVGLDPAILETIRFISTGTDPRPRRVAVVPAGPNAGDIYVTNYQEDTLTIIDGVTHLVAATLPTLPVTWGDPEDVVITPNGAFAYVMCRSDTTIMKFNTATRSDTGITIGTMTNNDDLAMDPTGLILISGGYHVIDLATDLEIGNTGITGETAIEPGGTFAYVVQSSPEEIAVVDTTTFLEIAPRINIQYSLGGSNPTEIAMDPVTTTAYIVQRNLQNISFVDTVAHLEIDTDGNPLTTDPGAITGISRAYPQGVTFEVITADTIGNVYVVATGSDVLSIMDPTTVPPTVLANVTIGNAPFGLAVTP